MEVVFESIVAETLPPVSTAPVAPPSFSLVEEPLFFMFPEMAVWIFEAIVPGLVILLIPFLILGRWGIEVFLFLRVLIRKVGYLLKSAFVRWWMETFEDPKIPRDHKCPACGHREKHKIYYMREYKSVMHQCGICSAVFATPTVIKTTLWEVVPIQDAEKESKAPWAV
jgi:ribosomal protein L37AE/L43A